MKKFINVFHIIICCLCAAASLFFAYIEGWLLFAGDWTLFENIVIAFAQSVVRFLLPVVALVISILSMISKKQSFVTAGASMLAASFAAVPFISNNFGWCFVGASALFLIAEIAYRRKDATVQIDRESE